LDGNGKAEDDETLWKIYARYNRQADPPPAAADVTDEKAKEFVIAFDRGDVAWLRGYCHLLSAMAEVFLAHDSQELFNHSAHLAFAQPESPFSFLKHRAGKNPREDDIGEIVDLIATIHLIRLPVIEPRRMLSALEHLEAMAAL